MGRPLGRPGQDLQHKDRKAGRHKEYSSLLSGLVSLCLGVEVLRCYNDPPVRRAHLIAGLLAIAAFLMTGMIMRTHAPPMAGLSHEIRLMYRSRHLYILAAAIANLLLGLYLVRQPTVGRRILQHLGSMLFLIAPVLLVLAFAAEPPAGLTDHTWRSSLGQYALFGGGIAHLLAAAGATRK